MFTLQIGRARLVAGPAAAPRALQEGLVLVIELTRGMTSQ
jgi:hypothetical protein